METEVIIYKFSDKSNARECYRRIIELYSSEDVNLDNERSLIIISHNYFMIDHAVHFCEKYNGKRQILAK